MRTGLTSSQVTKNREKYGSNKLPEKKLKTGFQFFDEQIIVDLAKIPENPGKYRKDCIYSNNL